jgi:hypothetical protein
LLGDLEHSLFHRLKNLEVASTAAQVARERYTDLIAIGMWIVIQQSFRGDQDRGRAVPALRRSEIGECILERMKVSVRSEPLDREHILAVALKPKHKARKHGLPIQKHCARAALAQFAAVFRAGVT